MKKISKFLIFAICTLTLLAGLFGCSNGKVKIIKDENVYTFTNKLPATAELDEGMIIDGKFDEARWNNSRWLIGVDRANAKQYADIYFTTSYGQKGVYFGIKVEEHGTNIYVNPDRASYLNSCIEMYMGLATDPSDAQRIFEFDFLANGQYSAKQNLNGFVDVSTTYDKMPIVASNLIGGKINTTECTGYYIEAFFPYTFLEHAGYDVSNPDEMVFGIDPVHIFSFNYNGTDLNMDRYWSCWSQNYISSSWLTPSSFFYFGKNGLVAYDFTVNYGGSGKGTVTEKHGLPYALKKETTFVIKTVNGAGISKLLINGIDYKSNLKYSDGSYTLTLSNITEDLTIDIDFD